MLKREVLHIIGNALEAVAILLHRSCDYLLDVLNVIARYDHWDPNADADGDAETMIRAGVSRDFLKKVSGAVIYERTTLESAKDAPEHGVFVRMQAGF